MKKTYFASDFHLGIDAHLTSRERELQIVRWLDVIRKDAEAIYLIGDIFDFWFEYKMVIPKGYIRLFGKLAELRDAGIAIYFFIGNHDMWMFRYFEEELGIPIYRKPIVREIHGKTFFIGHGDGLGPKDYKYKMLKKIFANPICQWLFGRIHPNIGVGVANYWSQRRRKVHPPVKRFYGPQREWLIAYAHRKLENLAIDYFVFGHRHLAIDYTLKNGTSRYINTGEWLYHNSYAVFDGQNVEVRFFEHTTGVVHGKVL